MLHKSALRANASCVRSRDWRTFTPSLVQRSEHGFGMGLGDAEQGAGGSFGAAVALFPVLEGTGADADERGELRLGEAEFFAHGLGIRPFQGGGSGGLLLAAKYGLLSLKYS